MADDWSFGTPGESDFEPLLAIRIAVMREHLERVFRYEPTRARRIFRGHFDEPGLRLILSNGERVGCVGFRRHADEVRIDSFYLERRLHNSGLGARILRVLLAEADVPYDQLLEMDEINPRMENVDVAIVIGANDVVNPAARENESSPIYGMPVINVDHARTVFVLKRSMASGFAGIENPLFYKENTRMLFGDAKESIAGLVREFS